MQVNKALNMWLTDSTTEIDLKVHKATIRAKRAITSHSRTGLRKKGDINASGQRSIEADLVAENVFLQTLISEDLTGYLYSEESGMKPFGNDPDNPDEAIILLLDPLDGSQNYLKGLSFGCISVAYGNYVDSPKLNDLDRAIIANLYRDELYHGSKGGGAFFNGEELIASEFDDNSGLSSFHISYYAYGNKGSQFYMNEQAHYEFRSLGSAAWELAMVIDERNDAYVDLRNVLKAHDLAAARILIQEAQGCFKFLSLDKFKSEESIELGDFKSGFSVLATNNEYLMNRLLKDFAKYEFI